VKGNSHGTIVQNKGNRTLHGDDPGDTVQVQGPEIMAAFGELIEEKRTAVITRASKLEQLWTRATGDFEFMELCEFSFSDEVLS
jgi:hypothetical protein